MIKPLRLRGKGYDSQIQGDFYIKLNIVNEEMNEEDKEIIESLKQTQ